MDLTAFDGLEEGAFKKGGHLGGLKSSLENARNFES